MACFEMSDCCRRSHGIAASYLDGIEFAWRFTITRYVGDKLTSASLVGGGRDVDGIRVWRSYKKRDFGDEGEAEAWCLAVMRGDLVPGGSVLV